MAPRNSSNLGAIGIGSAVFRSSQGRKKRSAAVVLERVAKPVRDLTGGRRLPVTIGVWTGQSPVAAPTPDAQPSGFETSS